MNRSTERGHFEKVGQCLYRFSTSGSYFALIRRSGKQMRHNLGTKNRTVANRELRVFLARVDSSYRSPDKLMIKDLAARYLDMQKSKDRSTQNTRRGMVKKFMHEFVARRALRVSDVKPSELRQWHSTALEHHAKATRNEYLRVIRQMFQIAVDDGALYKSPCDGWKEEKRGTPIRDTPSMEEFTAIVESIRGQAFSAHAEESATFLEFLGLAGVGNSEAAALSWEDVDWNRGKIRLLRNKTDTGFEIPVFPAVRPVLERLYKLSDGRGRVFGVSNIKRALEAACKRLGLPHYQHRSFRRMFITRAIENGIDFKTIASWQGHRDGGVLVARTYSHLRTEHADAMAVRMC